MGSVSRVRSTGRGAAHVVAQERRELEERVREVVERVRNARLEEAEALYRDGEVVVVAREIFTRFGIAVSFSLRYTHAQGEGKRDGAKGLLTVGAVPHAAVQPLRERDALLELVDTLAHGEEALVRLADARERVEQAVGDAVDHAGRGLYRGMRDVLVHNDMLGEVRMLYQ